MTDPEFLVSVPEKWLNHMASNPIDLGDVEEFYVNLFVVLLDMGIRFKRTSTIKALLQTDGIYLSHHTHYPEPNIWNIKKGYIRDYLYFDRTGYSGWAEIADSEKLFARSQRYALHDAKCFFDDFVWRYKQHGGSKVTQSKEKFKLDEPYVFVVGQRPNDTVAQLSRIPTTKLVKYVAQAYADTEYKVVFKPHPMAGRAEAALFAYEHPNIVTTNASIHKILPNCSAVYTVNSGVGFEALLYLKRVFTTGHCDYHWVTTRLGDHPKNIEATAYLLDVPVDENAIMRFVYYMIGEYFVQSNDLDSIRSKVELAISEYEP